MGPRANSNPQILLTHHPRLSPPFISALGPDWWPFTLVNPNNKQHLKGQFPDLPGIYEWGAYIEWNEDMRPYGLTPDSHFIGPANVVVVYNGKGDILRVRILDYLPK